MAIGDFGRRLVDGNEDAVEVAEVGVVVEAIVSQLGPRVIVDENGASICNFDRP